MRFMMLMIPKEYETEPPGIIPDGERIDLMTRFNEALQKAGVLLALDRLHPPSMGARVSFSAGVPTVRDGPFAEAKEVLGGVLADPGQVEGRGDRVGQALPRLRRRGRRDPPGAGDG